MSLTTGVEAGRRRAVRKLALLLGVGCLVVAGVAFSLYALIGDGEMPSESARATRTAPTAAPTPAGPDDVGIWTRPAVADGPLILPAAAGSERGVPIGYPHTVEGAISAAARLAEATVTLDPNSARAVGEVAAAPSYPTAGDDFATNTVTARKGLGLGPTGPTYGAYLSFQAKAYLVRAAEADRVTVWILGLAEGAGPSTDGQAQGGPSIAALTLVWAGGDWKFTSDDDATPPAPTPGSAEAYQQGWRDLAIA